MPRSLKPFVIREVTHRESGSKFTIYLDRNTTPNVFYAEVGGMRVEDETEDGCKRKGLERISEITEYQWRKIISVSTGTEYSRFGAGEVRLSFSVHEIARRPDGKFAERRVAHMPFSGETQVISSYHGFAESHPDRGVYVLDYSPMKEAALTRIREGFSELHRRLGSFLGSEDAGPRLEGLAGLLPASSVSGEQEDEEE